MPRVGLSEALELLVLIHAHDRTRFSRAALRRHSRFERELDGTIEESQAALAALAAMKTPAWRSAASALAVLVGGLRELRQGAEALVRRGTS